MVKSKANRTENIIVFVLGMGRSGSSAMARVLSLCGGRLPASLLQPNRFNPTGYWEPSSAIKINARFLNDIGSSFFDTQLVQNEDYATKGDRFVADIAELLLTYCPSGSDRPLIVKEPRISILLPYWLAAAEGAGFSPRAVISIRQPHEVASSLHSWKGLSKAHATELWLKYNLLAERHTRHLRRAFICYDRLLADWRREVGALARAIGIPITFNDEVDRFLRPELRHEVEMKDSETSPDHVMQIYRKLCSASNGGKLDVATLDATFREISKAQAAGSLPVIRSFGEDFGVA